MGKLEQYNNSLINHFADTLFVSEGFPIKPSEINFYLYFRRWFGDNSGLFCLMLILIHVIDLLSLVLVPGHTKFSTSSDKNRIIYLERLENSSFYPFRAMFTGVKVIFSLIFLDLPVVNDFYRDLNGSLCQ